MTNRWQKLNFLIPDPQCTMKEIAGVLQIINWNDGRPQPTDAAIDAVTDQEVIDSESATNKTNEFNKQPGKAIALFVKDELNVLRALHSLPALTNNDIKTKIEAYLP